MDVQDAQPEKQLPYRVAADSTPDIGNSPILKRPIILGDLTLGSPTTQTTVGAAGGASALPATPTGYLTVNVGNTSYVIPYYAIS